MPLGIAILVFLVDQLVKVIVVSNMYMGQSIPIVKDVLHLTYIVNPGAAFGMLENQHWIFILVAIALMLVFACFYKRIQRENIWVRCGSGLLLGGAAGNLLDRIQTGLVIDFLDFRIWPVFNLADVAICVGAGMLIYDIWRGRDDDEEKLFG